MSLISELEDLRKRCEQVEKTAVMQEHIFIGVINGVVNLFQETRVAKNFYISDKLRDLLNNAGITVTQGTAGYTYDEIPGSLRGRSVDDAWGIDK